MEGILNLNKPAGKTSFQVTALLKRLSKTRRVGHCGTLDPGATGVLPVLFGRATRIAEFLLEGRKVYRFQVELGITTDTYDISGRVLQTADASSISREQVEDKLSLFRGVTRQTPPMFSAVHYQGRRLYDLAREGIEVEREERTALVYRLEILEWCPPDVTLEVEVGRGVYVRSLAHDLGQALGCGAVVKELARLRVGPLTLNSAFAMEDVDEAVRQGYGQSLLYSMDMALSMLPPVLVDQEGEKFLRNGCMLAPESIRLPYLRQTPSADHVRAYSTAGSLLGVLLFDRDKQQWRPQRVFPSAAVT